jgi:hypothetical protein
MPLAYDPNSGALLYDPNSGKLLDGCCCDEPPPPVVPTCDNTEAVFEVSGVLPFNPADPTDCGNTGGTGCSVFNQTFILSPIDFRFLGESGCGIVQGPGAPYNQIAIPPFFECEYEHRFDACGGEWSWNLWVAGKVGVGCVAMAGVLQLPGSYDNFANHFVAHVWQTDPPPEDGIIPCGSLLDFDYTFRDADHCESNESDQCNFFTVGLNGLSIHATIQLQ